MSRRPSGRGPDELRPVDLEVGAAPRAEGSCLFAMGETRVLCTATVQEGVPAWREGAGGWITGEYAMLPRATDVRTPRERSGPRGRTQEIQRLIGRALRATTNLKALGPRTVIIDCDVLGADGGTRTAAITGGCVALASAFAELVARGQLDASPLERWVAAVSVGIVDGRPLLDLDYAEDVAADVDMNFAALDDGRIVEVQGTAEAAPFSRGELESLITLAERGVAELIRIQKDAMRG